MTEITLRIDPHVHSEGSYDGTEPVDLILEHAADIGLDAVVVTDHDVIHESLRAAELAPEYGLVGIPGVEVSTAHGHLLAIGVEEMPPHGAPFDETVAWIRDRGGVAIVPHPFQRSRHGVRKRFIGDCDVRESNDSRARQNATRSVDAVETFNAWLFTGYRNRRARRFADANGYPDVAASDAHKVQYVGRAYTEVTVEGVDRESVTAEDVLDAIRTGSTRVKGTRAPVPVSAHHYAVGAARRSGYYAKVGALKSGYYAKVGALRTASLAKLGAVHGGYAAKTGALRSARGLGNLVSSLR